MALVVQNQQSSNYRNSSKDYLLEKEVDNLNKIKNYRGCNHYISAVMLGMNNTMLSILGKFIGVLHLNSG